MKTLNSAQFVTHLMATTARGVEVVNPFDYPEMELMNFRDFMNELSNICDDEVIFTAVDPEELEEVKSEYGVK